MKLEEGRVLGWVAVGAAVVFFLSAHGWYLLREQSALPPAARMLMPVESGRYRASEDIPRQVLDQLRYDEGCYIRERSGIGQGKVVGYHFFWRAKQGNANRLLHRPDTCMPSAGWQQNGPVEIATLKIGGHPMEFRVFPFSTPGGPVLVYWAAYLNGRPAEAGGGGMPLPMRRLWDYIRTGTRRQSYEVAAFLIPLNGGRPDAAQIEAVADSIFSRASD